MRKNAIYLLLLLLVLFSCNRTRKSVLTGKWQIVKFENNLQMLVGKWDAVLLENPEMDSFFRNSQLYIDTVGKNNDAATNLRLYGVANMDSMRVILQRQYDSTKEMLYKPVANTSFLFRDDGVAILSFHGNIDSSHWNIDSLGELILDDLNDASSGDKVNLEIISITDTALKLRFRENNAYSIVTFHPEGSRESREQAIPNSYFLFRPDSIVLLSFNGSLDSNWYYRENDSLITVGNIEKKQAGTLFEWNIIALTDTGMRLRITENSSISTFTFRREGK